MLPIMTRTCEFLVTINLILLVVPVMIQQSATKLLISYSEFIGGENQASLTLYFSVTDEAGRALINPSIEKASIIVDGITYPAEPYKPTSELFLTIALDTSGSMQGIEPQMHAAAIAALDKVPPNTQIEIITFNENITLVQPFTSNLQSVIDTIGVLQADNSGTRLYDAIYQAVEDVKQAAPNNSARRAVLVFTDGRDECTQGMGDTCSFQTDYQQIVALATNSEAPVPIYTIGLVGRGGADEDELRRLAAATGGLSAVSYEQDLGSLFSEIIGGLTSQMAATSVIYPGQGKKSATLEIFLDDGTFLPGTVTFTSDRDYVAPSQPVRVLQFAIERDVSQQVYTVEIRAENMADVYQWEVQIFQDGTKVTEYQFAAQTAAAFEFGFDNLVPGGRYEIQLFALDSAGNLIKNVEGEVLQSEHAFMHVLPPEEILPSVVIDSVIFLENPPHFLVTIFTEDVSNTLLYEVTLLNKETKPVLSPFQPEIRADSTFTIPLETQTPGEYIVQLRVLNSRGEFISPVEPFPALYPAPDETSIMVRLFAGLLQNWYLPVLLTLVFLAVAIFWIVRIRSHKSQTGLPYLQKKGLPQPSSQGSELVRTNLGQFDRDKPMPFPAPISSSNYWTESLSSLTVIRSAGGEQDGRQIRLAQTNYPFTIGRENCNLTLSTDKRISRQHARLIFEHGNIFIEDLGSSNGTYVNGSRLQPRQPVQLTTSTLIRLGQSTELEFRIL